MIPEAMLNIRYEKRRKNDHTIHEEFLMYAIGKYRLIL